MTINQFNLDTDLLIGDDHKSDAFILDVLVSEFRTRSDVASVWDGQDSGFRVVFELASNDGEIINDRAIMFMDVLVVDGIIAGYSHNRTSYNCQINDPECMIGLDRFIESDCKINRRMFGQTRRIKKF